MQKQLNGLLVWFRNNSFSTGFMIIDMGIYIFMGAVCVTGCRRAMHGLACTIHDDTGAAKCNFTDLPKLIAMACGR